MKNLRIHPTINIPKLLCTALSVFLLFYLLGHSEQAVLGARDGLLLWYHSVLPVLLPFMIVCSFILQMGLADALLNAIHPIFHLLFGCSKYGSIAVLIGFLCGFPMGAKITHDLLSQKKISPEEAAHLYGFVNNPSPGFLLSYTAVQQLHMNSRKYLFLIWVPGAAFLYGILTRKQFSNPEYTKIPESQNIESSSVLNIFRSLDQSIDDSMWNILRLGGCMILFSMVSSFIQSSGSFHSLPQLIAASLPEITGGVRLVSSYDTALPRKWIICSGLCSFGGLCALMQTILIAEMDWKQIKHYIKSRVIITLLSTLLSMITLFFFFSVIL